MIRLLARLCHTDWAAPLTVASTDVEQLHRLAAWEQQIRADAIRSHVCQHDTASGAPPRRIGLYTEIHG